MGLEGFLLVYRCDKWRCAYFRDRSANLTDSHCLYIFVSLVVSYSASRCHRTQIIFESGAKRHFQKLSVLLKLSVGCNPWVNGRKKLDRESKFAA
jgi:hypothetical protein